MRLLLVEDDEDLGEGIRVALKPEGYTVDWVRDGAGGLRALSQESFDIAVLDLGLPGMDGLDVLRHLRRAAIAVPVLVLTARDATGDRIAGLDAGADDYLVKPFEVDELKARLRALLRRSLSRPQPAIEHQGVRLDLVSQEVSYQGRPVVLQRKEFLVLHQLLSQPGRVFTRDKLEQALYGWDEVAESNAIDVHIHHLRRKLGAEAIETQRGLGWRLAGGRR
jgi:two-component system response regulator QseB